MNMCSGLSKMPQEVILECLLCLACLVNLGNNGREGSFLWGLRTYVCYIV